MTLKNNITGYEISVFDVMPAKFAVWNKRASVARYKGATAGQAFKDFVRTVYGPRWDWIETVCEEAGLFRKYGERLLFQMTRDEGSNQWQVQIIGTARYVGDDADLISPATS